MDCVEIEGNVSLGERIVSTVKSVPLKVPATLLAVGIALSAFPALSQSAMTPGGGAMAPQPRVAPTVAPPAPVAAPQMPVAIPNVSGSAPGEPAKLTVRKAGEAQTEYLKAPDANSGGQPGPTGGPQRIARTPLSSVAIGLEGDPGSFAAGKGATDAGGNVTFKDLKPGNYRVQLPNAGPQGGAVSMTTFVNGKLASRTEFPVGSSVGTFAVGSAKDTITLKFERNAPPPGGTGSGARPARAARAAINGDIIIDDPSSD